MNRRPTEHHQTDHHELAASLQRLGVRELEERLEVSPLLTVATETPDEGSSVCCSCKFPPDILEDGKLPYPQLDPIPTSTGPTSGL